MGACQAAVAMSGTVNFLRGSCRITLYEAALFNKNIRLAPRLFSMLQ
jgi:hypothetical protein